MAPSKRLLVLPAARDDIDAATDFHYAEGGETLGTRWAHALESALRHIASHAATGSPRYAVASGVEALRFWQTKRFPYLVFYIAFADQISVIRVLHASRDIPASLREEE